MARHRRRRLGSDYATSRGPALRWVLVAVLAVAVVGGWLAYRAWRAVEPPVALAHEAVLQRTGEYPNASRLVDGPRGKAVCGDVPGGRFIYQVRTERLLWEPDAPAEFRRLHDSWCP